MGVEAPSIAILAAGMQHTDPVQTSVGQDQSISSHDKNARRSRLARGGSEAQCKQPQSAALWLTNFRRSQQTCTGGFERTSLKRGISIG